MAVEEQPGTKKKALVVRMRKNHRDGKLLVLDSIIVQNSSLKKTLGEVFHAYEGITASLKKLVFRSPFHEFYYRWKGFTQMLEHQQQHNRSAAKYTRLLYDVLHAELRDDMTEVDDLISHGVVTYHLLWTLFEPGAHVMSKNHEKVRFYVVDSFEYRMEGFFSINVKFVDWDGHRFGYAEEGLTVREFAGTRSTTSLDVFPANCHPTKRR